MKIENFSNLLVFSENKFKKKNKALKNVKNYQKLRNS